MAFSYESSNAPGLQAWAQLGSTLTSVFGTVLLDCAKGPFFFSDQVFQPLIDFVDSFLIAGFQDLGFFARQGGDFEENVLDKIL